MKKRKGKKGDKYNPEQIICFLHDLSVCRIKLHCLHDKMFCEKGCQAFLKMNRLPPLFSLLKDPEAHGKWRRTHFNFNDVCDFKHEGSDPYLVVRTKQREKSGLLHVKICAA